MHRPCLPLPVGSIHELQACLSNKQMIVLEKEPHRDINKDPKGVRFLKRLGLTRFKRY